MATSHTGHAAPSTATAPLNETSPTAAAEKAAGTKAYKRRDFDVAFEVSEHSRCSEVASISVVSY
jgi:hypothetical protein